MKKLLQIFILIGFCIFKTNAQTVNETFLSVIEVLPSNISAHIPKGFQVLDTTFGNLNFDSYTDLIVVLKSPKEDTATDLDYPIKRPLLILFGEKNNTYRLAFQNSKVVMCIICGGVMGDPFNNVAIKNGYFTVENSGGSSWRWTDYLTFKYDKLQSKFYLHRQDISNFHASNPDKVEKIIKTKKNFGTVDFENYK